MKIRVLVVDDSAVIRRIISELLSSDSAVQVAGVAANGRIAVEKIPQVNPDVVTLDIDMPEMDGLQTLAVMRKNYPRLPVIILSTLSERGAAITLEALSLGASDYVTKAANADSSSAAMAHIRDELLSKIKALCRRQEGHEPSRGHSRPPQLWKNPVPAATTRVSRRVEVVAIGVSTGGPNALAQLLPAMPVDFPVPIVIAQHMPPVFTKILAERLAARTAIDVREGRDGGALAPGRAWIAPGNHHMLVERQGNAFQLKLNQDPPENSCRPAVDVLFRSVAATYGSNALAVVLTGMGQDGLRGCEEISEAGGQILAQDEASSVVWGMPGLVAKAGLANTVVPLSQIAGEILRRVQAGKAKEGMPAQEGLHRVYLGS